MLSLIVTLVVVALHLGFMALETFLWTTPAVRKIFGQSAEHAALTRALAANQGVYNGVLAVCLAWAALAGNTSAHAVLLGFVVAVGLYGGATVKPSILVLQALPAALALALLLLGL